MTNRLDGNIALVTGASRGLGRAIAIGFAREGADVVVNYLNNEKAAKETAAEITKLGRRVCLIQADVTSRKDIQRMVKEAENHFNKIDILVNNAGINKRGWFEEITDEDWDLIMETNLTIIYC